MAEAVATESKLSNLDDPALYFNRDLSLIEFQRRVLEEAQSPDNPLLERLKFLAILFSNLDEFFMVRVARPQQRLESKSAETGPDSMSPSGALDAFRASIIQLTDGAYKLFNKELMPALDRAGIYLLCYDQLNDTGEGRSIAKEGVFTRIFRGSVLMHHPFESFQPVIDFPPSGCS